MAENHAMNLSIIYHLAGIKAKIETHQNRFSLGLFHNTNCPHKRFLFALVIYFIIGQIPNAV